MGRRGYGLSNVFTLHPIGYVSSPLSDPALAPKQAHEGGPAAWLEFLPEVAPALRDLAAGDELLVLTWLDRADRTTLEVHPRDNPATPLRGVFSTRSADRPNPIGIHRVTVVEVASPTLSRRRARGCRSDTGRRCETRARSSLGAMTLADQDLFRDPTATVSL